jgi:hypothetical protein
VRFEIVHQSCEPESEWREVGSEEAESAEHALQLLQAREDLAHGWYRARGLSGEAGEFFLDRLGLTKIA